MIQIPFGVCQKFACEIFFKVGRIIQAVAVWIGIGVVLTVRKEGRKEGNVLFNDALNTFYLRLYGVRGPF